MIKLEDLYSSRFVIRCGVKQDGILSPFLFNFFINDMIEQCVKKKIGARFENLNVSIIVYCDDILLISPIMRHMQKLIEICSDYGKDWAIKFNAEKSSFICFGPQIYSDVSFSMNGEKLQCVETLKILGIQFNRKLDMNADAIERF